MSISTKTGDKGTTALMFGRRVPKTHPRVEAYGHVDELSCALGLAKTALESGSEEWALLDRIQVELMMIMTELAVDDADREKWLARGKPKFEAAQLSALEADLARIEQAGGGFTGFELPGQSERHARFHMARVVCRRAERQLLRLIESGIDVRAEIVRYLNRLSDLLWLLARD